MSRSVLNRACPRPNYRISHRKGFVSLRRETNTETCVDSHRVPQLYNWYFRTLLTIQAKYICLPSGGETHPSLLSARGLPPEQAS